MEGCINLPIKDDELTDLVEQATDYAMSHGVVYRTAEKPSSPELVTHAPFQLFPSPVPKHCYELASAVQKDYNLLMHRVAHDYEFLKDCLKSAITVDDFTGRLWNIYETVRKEGIAQPISLGMNRSDYMFHAPNNSTKLEDIHLKQIEFNTMASSFGGLSQQISQLHRYIFGVTNMKQKMANLPENNCVSGLAEGLCTAWKHYGNERSVVVMLVSDPERNIYDQRLLMHAVLEQNSNVKFIRRTLQDFEERGKLTEDRKLMIDDMEVAVLYFRVCYVPDHFTSEKSWETRLMMERSTAIKCPNVYYHLSGTKKVQQVLAQPGVVERFIPDKQAADRIRATFAGQYSLDMGAEGDEAVAMAMADPDKFVLKPQREGGGNNVFGEDIRTLLSKIKDSEERTAYILMERIHPATVQNYAVRSGQPVELREMISEVGIFGTLVGSDEEIFLNDSKGHILRTKTVGTDEGGVATGYSALDSPYLV